MYLHKLKISLLGCCFLFITGIYGQMTVDSSGSEATGSGGTVNYSVGQIVFTTNTGSNGSVGQGVQYPIELLTLGIEEDIQLIASAIAFPNPTTNSVQLRLNLDEFNDLSFQLLDVTGKLIQDKKIEDISTQINMLDLPTAVYFLKIMRFNTNLKTFRILKTN
jgi:hypothetical protein